MNLHEVEYLLVGGYAVSYHGYPRATADMDIWIAIQKENAEKLVAVLREFGFDTPELTASLFLRQNQIIRMGNPPMRIELLTTISGVRFEECYSERISDVIDNVEVQIINLEHLKTQQESQRKAEGFG